MADESNLSRRERRLRARRDAIVAAFNREAEERRKRIAEGPVMPPEPPDPPPDDVTPRRHRWRW